MYKNWPYSPMCSGRNGPGGPRFRNVKALFQFMGGGNTQWTYCHWLNVEKGCKSGSGHKSKLEKKKKKPNKVRDRVKRQTGSSSSSAVHDHLDQLCKRDETAAMSNFSWSETPSKCSQRGDACPPPPHSAHPTRQKVALRRASGREGEREREGGVSQSSLTPIQPKCLAAATTRDKLVREAIVAVLRSSSREAEKEGGEELQSGQRGAAGQKP